MPSNGLASPLPDLEGGLVEQLRRATRPPAVLEVLRRDWSYPRARGLRLADCEVARVHWRGGRGFVIEYEMRFEDGSGERIERFFGELAPEDVAARRRDALERLGKSRRRQIARGQPSDLVAGVAELGLVLRIPGLDERIHGLDLLRKPKTFMPTLARSIEVPEDRIGRGRAELLAHRLGKRAVIRFYFRRWGGSSNGRRDDSVIVKMYKNRGDNSVRAHTAMDHLWRNGFDGESDIRVPRPIACLADSQSVLMEDVSGTPLQLLEGEALTAGMTEAGRALAKLHRSRVPTELRFTVADETALLERWSGLVSGVFPDLRPLVTDALSRTLAGLSECRDFEPALIHRDYHEKQILIDGPRAALIDFDSLCYGDPALDLGNFLAHLRLAALQEGKDRPHLAEAFLDGHGGASQSGLDGRTTAYCKSALLRLACLYVFSTRWCHLSEPILKSI